MKAAGDLNRIASAWSGVSVKNAYSIAFNYYGDVGQFIVSTPAPGIDSVTLTRSFPDSTSAIQVSNTQGLFQITGLQGALILRGLTFNIANSKAVLISGKQSGNLVLDNCLIYADTLESRFIDWTEASGKKVEFRNCFFVSKRGNPAARIRINAGEMVLSNNLFNFAGGVEAVVSNRADVNSNTVNRTQFRLSSEIIGGATFNFGKNFIAHPPAVTASFASGIPWVLYHSDFDTSLSLVKNNRMYNTWGGFDYSSAGLLWAGANKNNLNQEPSLVGKASTELWNWYTDGIDTGTGMLNGPKKGKRFTIFPESTSTSWPTSRGRLTVKYKSSLFPRIIEFDTTSYTFPVLENPALRPVFARTGALYFGPFQVESVTLESKAIYGKPVLLANDSAGKYQVQPGVGLDQMATRIFTNASPTARLFVLVDSCNTSRGLSIRPGAASGLKTEEKLVFENVDSAGFLKVSDFPVPTIPNDLRWLNKQHLYFNTTASINAKVAFGLPQNAKPYWPDSTSLLKWLVVTTSDVARIPAVKTDTGKDAGSYLGTVNYNSGQSPTFSVFLVEELTVPMGGKLFPISGGSVKADAALGYQLKIDSVAIPADSVEYALFGQGYRLSWAGRGDSDKVLLTQKAASGSELFVRIGTAVPRKLDVVPDSAGNYVYPIAVADADKVFFQALKYNIIKGRLYDTVAFDDVTIGKYISSSSGILRFETLTSAALASTSSKDTTFKSARFLSGRMLIATNLNPMQNWEMAFPAPDYYDLTKVMAFGLDGSTWIPLEGGYPGAGAQFRVRGIPPSVKKVVVVERLPAVEQSVITDTLRIGEKFIVSTKYKLPPNPRITHFCVVLKSVNQLGNVETVGCEKTTKPIGGADTLTLLDGQAYAYFIRYMTDGVPYNIDAFTLLPGTSWDRTKVIPKDSADKERFFWHLLSFPYAGNLKSSFDVKPKDPNDTAVDTSLNNKLDTTAILRIKTVDDAADWDRSAKAESFAFKPGEAFLIASARTRTLAMDPAAKFLPLQTVSIPVKQGWNFISNPFPTTFRVSRLSTSPPSTHDKTFRKLVYEKLLSGGKVTHTYVWKPDSLLVKFKGYAYYAPVDESLVFDPLAESPPASARKSAASGTGPVVLEARLRTPWGASSMSLSATANAMDVPYLPTPAGIQLRVGGKAGFMIKSVKDAAAIDEPMEIRSPEAGLGAFTLEKADAGVSTLRLIHLKSGRIYDEAGAASLPLSKGSQTFRLIAGDEAFVQDRVRAFQAGAPREILLSQNYPNPFRGKTRVTLAWPAWDNGDRRALLEVVDMQGRSAARIDLGEVRVGRQTVTLDASQWRSGVYLYRLTVITGGRKATLQKKMLVSP